MGEFKACTLPIVLFLLIFSAVSSATAQTNLNDLVRDEPATSAATMPTAEPQAADEPQTAETSPAPQGDTLQQFEQMARKYEQAVALVVLSEPNGDTYPTGTAWAFEPDLLATNAHISEPVAAVLAAGGRAYVIPNKSRGTYFTVTAAATHPSYPFWAPNPHGRRPTGVPYDIGVLQIDGSFATTVKVADIDTLHGLDAGSPVAFIGFPMEELHGDNVNTTNPVATMQVANITSVTDYYLEDRGPSNNRLIRHSLPATGGASGSPIFNSRGEVVAIVNAINIEADVWKQFTFEHPMTGEDVSIDYVDSRSPSAAQINFGQRIDILDDVIQR